MSSIYAQRFQITRGKAVRTKNLAGGYRTSYIKHPDYWKKVGCLEFRCEQYQKGWTTTLSMNPGQSADDLMMMRARYNYIKNNSGRSFDESLDGYNIVLRFPAEQECFREHLLPIERDPVFIRNRNQLDYDQFFDEFNETIYQLEQVKQAG